MEYITIKFKLRGQPCFAIPLLLLYYIQRDIDFYNSLYKTHLFPFSYKDININDGNIFCFHQYAILMSLCDKGCTENPGRFTKTPN